MKRTFTFISGFLSLFILFLSPVSGFSANDEICEEEAVDIILNCPSDVTVSCTDEIWDLSSYGNATYYYNGSWLNAGTPVVNYNLNSCNIGFITRTWTVEDYQWNQYSCTQTITVTGGGYNSFNESDINWPIDNLTLEGCYPQTHPSQLPPGYGYPTWTNTSPCSSIGVSYSDQVFWISNTCKKIVRKWQVMDWCQFNPNYGGYNIPGLWTHYQFIKISMGDIPALECPADVTANSSNCYNAYVNFEPIWVNGDACGGNFTVTNNSIYADNNGADASGTYPVGWHTIKYTVEYGCGQKKTCTQKLKVTKKKPPTPYCFAEIVTSLMPVDEDGDGIPEDGMVEIWAKDLDKGSTASCNGGSLQFSFSSDVTDNVKTFTCADVGENEVQMWVTDSQGNQSYCVVIITVQNNAANIPDCEPEDDGGDDPGDDDNGGDDDDDGDDDGGGTSPHNYYISGDVYTVDGTLMDSVLVTIQDTEPDTSFVVTLDTTVVLVVDSVYNEIDSVYDYTVYVDTTITAEMDTIISNLMLSAFTDNGYYRFVGFAQTGDEYQLYADYSGTDYNSGIDVEDLDFLMDYVVGAATFTDPHQKYAADVDRDGNVDFDDLKILLDYLTGEIDDFGFASEWLIIDATQYETATAEEVYTNPDLIIDVLVDSVNVEHQDFIAIRLGDIVIDDAPGLVSDESLSSFAQKLTENNLEAVYPELKNILNQEVTHKAYPNPFSDNLTIEYQSGSSNMLNVQLLDITGKVLYNNNFKTSQGVNEFNIQVDRNYSGIMIYKLTEGNSIATGRVIKI